MKNTTEFDPWQWAFYRIDIPSNEPITDDQWPSWASATSDIVRDILEVWIPRTQQLYSPMAYPTTESPGALALMIPRSLIRVGDVFAGRLLKSGITMRRFALTEEDPVMCAVGPGWTGEGSAFWIKRKGLTQWVIEVQEATSPAV